MADESRRDAVGFAATALTGIVTWVVAVALPASAEPPAAAGPIAADFATFEAGLGGEVAAKLGCTAKHWRQIAPSLYHLATRHAAALGGMTEADRLAALVALAEFIDGKRKAAAATPVLADVFGLFDLYTPGLY